MKTEEAKIELFENKSIPKAIMELSIPTVIGCLVMVLYNLADTYFVGRLNDPIETAAVTLVAPIILAFNAVNNLFGTGTSSVISRALGSRDYEKAKKTSAFGFYMAIFSGLLFSVAVVIFKAPLLNLLGADSSTYDATCDYLFWTVILGAVPAILNVVIGFMIRAEGLALHATIGTMSGCLLNILLDPVFILPFGLNMGAAGAGLATFISNMVACLYFIILIIVKRGKIIMTIAFSMFKPDRATVIDIFSVGIPAAIQNLLNVTGMAIINKLAAGYSTEAVDAMGITHKLAMVPMYISMGMAQGVMPLVGYNFASKNRKRMRDATVFTAKIAGGFMIIAALVMIIFSEPIVRAFMDNDSIVIHGSGFLRGFALAQPFLGVDFLAVGIFQACGYGKRTFIFAVLRKLVLEIPALIILDIIFPLTGLAYAQFVAEFVLAIVAFILLVKLMKEE